MKRPDRSVLDNDNVGRLLFKQSMPALVALVVTATYGIVSTIFVGHFVGSLGIAGITVVQPIQFLSMGVGNMFGVGGASLISRLIGSGDRERAERTLGNAIAGVFIFSVIILAAGVANQDFWLRMLGATEEILPYARDYFTVILFGLFFQTFALTLASLTRSEGNARVAMTSMAIGGLSNILFDAFFVVYLRMGVRGAAIGTVIAQFLTVAYFLAYYLRGRSYLKINFGYMKIRWGIFKEILTIGFANCIMSFSTGTSNLFLNRALITYGGDIAVAGYGVINRLLILTILPGQAIGQGMQPILGFNYGTKRFDRAYRVLKTAVGSVVVISFVCFAALYLFPGTFIKIFTNDPELITTAVYMARHIFITVALSGWIVVSIMTFQSLGKVLNSYLLTLRSIIFLLPMVLILPPFFHFTGVLLAYPLTELFTFVIAVVLLVPQLRTFKRLSEQMKNKSGQVELVSDQATEP